MDVPRANEKLSLISLKTHLTWGLCVWYVASVPSHITKACLHCAVGFPCLRLLLLQVRLLGNERVGEAGTGRVQRKLLGKHPLAWGPAFLNPFPPSFLLVGVCWSPRCGLSDQRQVPWALGYLGISNHQIKSALVGISPHSSCSTAASLGELWDLVRAKYFGLGFKWIEHSNWVEFFGKSVQSLFLGIVICVDVWLLCWCVKTLRFLFNVVREWWI